MTTHPSHPSDLHTLLDPAAAASRLSCSPAMVRKLIQNRQIETVKVGRLVRIELSALDRYIEANRRPAVAS